jgi:hypothetical protein
MLSKKLAGLSGAAYVEYGYGQVEPNHLSARRTGQIYAQLPAAANIAKLENGQFVKYDYMNEEVNFSGAGEWMLVFNEVKLYRDEQVECEFAMLADNYVARIYSPVAEDVNWDAQARYLNGGEYTWTGDETVYNREKVTAPEQPRDDWNYNEDPFHFASKSTPKKMKEGTVMVPRVFKTNVGDIYTTNCVNEAELALGDILAPAADGFLSKSGETDKMQWQVVKVYTMPDRQKGVKIMRIA